MQHIKFGRKRSLLSRRQPDTEQVLPNETTVALTAPGSGSSLSPVNLDQRDAKPQQNIPLAIRMDHSQPPSHHDAAFLDQPFKVQPPETMIGVALGSPGIRPFTPEEGNTWTIKCPDLTSHSSPHASAGDISRQKGSRWKALDGLFGKRSGSGQLPTASSPYQINEQGTLIQPHGDQRKLQKTQPSAAQARFQDPGPASEHGSLSRDWIRPEQLPLYQNGQDQNFRRKTSMRRNYFAKKYTRDGKKTEASKTCNVTRHLGGVPVSAMDRFTNANISRQQSENKSLLQVEIPSVELERFSVMFNNLLYPSQQSISICQPSPSRQPSLLARRRAHLQNLYTPEVDGFERPWVEGELTRGNPAASPNKSTSFLLIPPLPRTDGRENHDRVRERESPQRSATAPSPSKAKFDFFSPGQEQDQLVVIVHTPTEHIKPQQRSMNEDNLSRFPSQMTKSSGDTFTTSLASTAPSIKSSLSPVDDLGRSPQREDDNKILPSGYLHKAANTSIARQVSISRRERRYLVSTVPKVVPQPVQPEIVDLDQGSRLRKSHHVAFANAEERQPSC